MSNESQNQQPVHNTHNAPKKHLVENHSGEGKRYPVPNIVKNKFNWGAFYFVWIWGLFNKTYITLIIFATMLLAIIPVIGVLINLGVQIWFGVKGNEWAWQNKRFKSVKAFHEYQKKWGAAAAIFISIMMLAAIVAMVLPTIMNKGF